jgi:hypothetical protein
MASTNERAPGERGAEELRTSPDCAADHTTHPVPQYMAGVGKRTTTCAPCPRCRTTIATIGPGAGPHHADLRCLRGHFLKWLPKPGGAV